MSEMSATNTGSKSSANVTSSVIVKAIPWAVVLTLAQRELVRFFRQKNRVFGALGQPIIFWLLFSEGLKQNGGLDYVHFFPGTLVMILLFTAIFATISIIEDRQEGFLQSVLVAPVPRWSMVLGKVFGGAGIAMIQGMFFFVLGWILLSRELSAGPIGIVLAIALMMVVSIALTALGFSLAWRMDSTQGFHAIMSVFLFPMWLLSGAFFPAGGTGVLGWIIALNPLTYGVAGIRRALQWNVETTAAEIAASEGLAALPSMWLCWVVSILFAVAMLAMAWRLAATRVGGDLL